MKRTFALIAIIALWSCSAQKNSFKSEPVSTKIFLNNPFVFAETTENFSSNTTLKFDVEKVAQDNKHYPNKKDTIYTFTYRKSEIIIYKSHTGKEFLLAGKIVDKKMKLSNSIRIGMSKNDFLKRFTDHLKIKDDRIQIMDEGTKYTFIFKNEKLAQIDIDNYFD